MTELDKNETPGVPNVESTPPVRVCKRCSTRSETAATNCPHCGASYVRGIRSLKGRVSRRVVVGIAAFGVLLVVAFGVKLVADHNAAADAKAKATAAKLAADRRAAAEAKAADELATLQQKLRDSSIKEMEASITKDARSRVNDGALDGPIINTQCEPDAAGADTLYTDTLTNFACLAVNKKVGGGQVEGYTFHATMNWDKFSYTWGLGQG